jgi:hypothetical protein
LQAILRMLGALLWLDLSICFSFVSIPFGYF